MNSRNCPICQEPINLYSCIILGRCAHVLCTDCWERFKTVHNTRKYPKCPVCRSLIHPPSIIHKEPLTYIRDTFNQSLRKENLLLRNILINITNYNRKELGEWKFNYKKYINDCDQICMKEKNSRIEIEQEHAVEILRYRGFIKNFVRTHNLMRESLKHMIQDYKPPIEPKYTPADPPDPVDTIPPEMMEEGHNPTPIASFPSLSHFHPTQISSITVGHSNGHATPGSVLDDVRQMIANIQSHHMPSAD